MSKLVELYNNEKIYDRLNVISWRGTKYSVREQGSAQMETKQKTALDAFDNKYQKGFTVNTVTNSLTGIRKSVTANTTEFTSGSDSTKALQTYTRYAQDASLNKYNSQLVHIYSATVTSAQYKTLNSAKPGIQLVYNPA